MCSHACVLFHDTRGRDARGASDRHVANERWMTNTLDLLGESVGGNDRQAIYGDELPCQHHARPQDRESESHAKDIASAGVLAHPCPSFPQAAVLALSSPYPSSLKPCPSSLLHRLTSDSHLCQSKEAARQRIEVAPGQQQQGSSSTSQQHAAENTHEPCRQRGRGTWGC